MTTFFRTHPRATPLAAALLLACAPLHQALAQATPATAGAGSLLQQTKPATPPVPAASSTGLTLDQATSGLPASAPMLVKTLAIAGNTVFDTATLHALVADAEGKTLTLPQLGQVIARITDYYRTHGYTLARAIVPAQRISGGVIDVQVLEARYGAVHLDNRSRAGDGLLAATLAPLQAGQMIGQAQLDRALLLLSDLPGMTIGATLKPGDGIGTSDLLVAADATPAISASALLDNHGNRYTGRARLGATVFVNNPLHTADQLSVGALTSGAGLNYGHLGYDIVVDGAGTRVSADLSALHYKLGGALDILDAHGTAQVAGLAVKQPLLRGQLTNLNAALAYDQQILKDAVDVSAVHTDRHVGAWALSLAGDQRDSLINGGVTSASLAWRHGQVSFKNAGAAGADAQSARTAGAFGKWNLDLARLQSITASDSLYVVWSGQWASTNLDAAEKMLAGGSYSVRAYDVGAVAGDSGNFASAEWRHAFGAGWQAIAFADSARVEVDHAAWVAGVNSARLSGVGAGVDWTGLQGWRAKATLATAVGARPALVRDNSSVRLLVELGHGF